MTEEDRTAKNFNVRQYVLIGVMLLLAAALAYDFYVARPAALAAYESIKNATDARLDSSEPQFTADEIREQVKRRPAVTVEGPRYDIDVFQWRAGLPWRTYYFKVVYAKANNERRYCSMFLNEEVDAEYLPDFRPDQPGEATAGEVEEPPPVGGEGGGAAPSDGGRPQRPPGDAAPADGGPQRPARPQRPNAESPDAESPDAESPDAESPDAESPDAESPDAESPDAEKAPADNSPD